MSLLCPPGDSLTAVCPGDTVGVSPVPPHPGKESRLAGAGQAQRGSAGRDFSACTAWDEEGKGGQGSPALSSPVLGLWARKALWDAWLGEAGDAELELSLL